MISTVHPLIALVLVAGLLAFIISMYLYSKNEDPGITTEIAAVVCCGRAVLVSVVFHARGDRDAGGVQQPRAVEPR